jgi:NAD(P)-dependent dehydrogenase (short-subunit alcohol dehydrogenase family)
MINGSFKGKVIIVQGGTKGFGFELVKNLLKLEAKVVFTGIENNLGFEIVKKLKNDNLYFYGLDLSVKNEIDSFFNFVKTISKNVDGYFHYAGVTHISGLDNCDEKTYDSIMNINTKSIFFSLQKLIPLMKKKGGSIVLVGSTQANRGQIDRTAYAMSKGALLTLNSHIALHYGKSKIRCNNLVMGWTLTDNEIELRKSLGQSKEEVSKIAEKYIPLGRLIEYKDLLAAALYLLSDNSSMVTGTNLYVNGGETI